MKGKGRVFLLDDDELIVSMLARALRSEGYEVRAETDPRGVIEKVRAFAPDAVLLDIKLPGKSGLDLLREIVDQAIARQVIMLTSDDSAETAVKAMKLGASDYVTKPFDLEEVKIIVGNAVEKGALKQEVDYLRRISSELTQGKEIVGGSAALTQLKQKALKLAEARVPTILITGESGTGKELLARYLHDQMHGDESSGYAPFVGINCAALPETLIESELFGHEKGSFTDAKSERKGVFELAFGGSVLLDEIAEMRPFLQSKLLRVLEERQVRRVGGRQDIPVNASVFATTNRDLEAAVKDETFRPDLYYRLNGFSLHVPALRERREDIAVLAGHFLAHFVAKYRKRPLAGISPEAEEMLRAYPWPGNVRELRNVIERIVVLESGDTVLPQHLPKEVLQASAVPKPGVAGVFPLPPGGISLDELERSLISQALQQAGGNKTQAAKLLNITYDSLRYQIKKFGLE